MVTPHYLFIIILVNTLGTELNVEKEKKKKIGQVLNVGNMFKNKENVSQKTDFWGFGNHGNKSHDYNNFFRRVQKKFHTLAKSAYYIGFSCSLLLWILFCLNKLRNCSLKIDHKLTTNTL